VSRSAIRWNEYFPDARETNVEGLTFVEWLCAVGMQAAEYVSGAVYMTTGAYSPYPHKELHAKHWEMTQAWRAGEDPSEHKRRFVMLEDKHTLTCAIHPERCKHSMAQIHNCVICEKRLGDDRTRLDTCSKKCFGKLCDAQRRG
jgi:hypothetical protein